MVVYPFFGLGLTSYEKGALQPIMTGRVLSGIILHFFKTKSYEKGPFGVFFRLHLDSLDMNDTEFALIGLVKLNTERPVQGMNPSFLRFIKRMRMDLSLDELKRVLVTLFELVKTKRGTHQS